MNMISISDVTMKQSGKASGVNLSFREKIELAKQLDRLGVNVIETSPITNPKVDALLIKSISTAVKRSVVAVPTDLEEGSAENAWNALKEAKHPRLQVCAPVSAVQMEYLARKKPAAESPAPAAPAPEKSLPLAPGSAGEVKPYDTDPRTAAMLMAIVADELQAPRNELRFISIREIKE